MATIKSEYYRFDGSVWNIHYFKTTMDMVDGLATALSGKAPASHAHTIGYFSTANASDLNTTLGTGQFSWGNTSTNIPVAGSYGQGLNIVSSGTAHNNSNNWITQLAFSTLNNTAFFRGKTNSGSWGSWHTFYHTGNKPTWADIASKPSWIGASKPAYTASDVGALPTAGGTLTGPLNGTNLDLSGDISVGGTTNINGTITSDGEVIYVDVEGIIFDGEGGWISNMKSPEYGHQSANKDYVDTKVAGYVPTTRTVNGRPLTGNISVTAAEIYSPSYDESVDYVLEDLGENKLSTNTIVRSKNALVATPITGTGYNDTGLSVFLASNSTYKISMTGHWERKEPGTTSWAYRHSIVSSASGVYMRGMWTWYPLDTYSGANTTVAYSNSMVSYSGYTGQTITTPSASTAVSNAPICFEGYIVTGSSSTTIKFTHGTSVSITPPKMSAFRGVLTAIKM